MSATLSPMVWTPATVGCYWDSREFTIGTYQYGTDAGRFPASGYELRRNRVVLGTYPTLEEAKKAAEGMDAPAPAAGDPRALNPDPKDIQEGTANHVRMILNACERGDAKEAGYLASDLLDQLVCRALVVTKRCAPDIDWEGHEKAKNAAFAEGVKAGRRAAAEEARKEIREKVNAALKGVL